MMNYRYAWLGLLLLFFAFPVNAAEEYSSIVDVDVTDVNAATAKEKAMLDANRRALNNVAPMLATQEGINIINSLSNEQIAYFIKDATIIEEKSSDVRYMATLKITIQDGILRQYLEEKGAAEEAAVDTIEVLYVFSSMSDWLKVEELLKTTKNIEKLETVAMSNSKVQFKLNYMGSFDELNRSLETQGFSLHDNNGLYILKNLESSFSSMGDYNDQNDNNGY